MVQNKIITSGACVIKQIAAGIYRQITEAKEKLSRYDFYHDKMTAVMEKNCS